MSWSFRKSISTGPFRMNFSKSGISYSVGVKGARINIGPRGTYVNLSSHGISYHQKISGPPTPGPLPQIPPDEILNNISSAAIDQLTDTDSKAFITALNEKSKKTSYVILFGIILSCIMLFILLSVFDNSQKVYTFTICAACSIPLLLWLKKIDKKRFQMELHYNMDDQYQQVYQQFSTYFENFMRSSWIWQHLNSQNTNDHKRNAGAGRVIRRVKIRGISAHKLPIPYFITNVRIPCISLSNIEMFFLPERLLIKRGNSFAAVFYKSLHINSKLTQFIESDMLPVDATVVDHTWQYVNKNGGPDKRFNNNRRLPVCVYSEYVFTSDTGIHEVISTSKQYAMDAFADFLSKIGTLQQRMSAFTGA